MKSADLIGHSKFLPWRQLDDCSVTRLFLSAKGVSCETQCTLVPRPSHHPVLDNNGEGRPGSIYCVNDINVYLGSRGGGGGGN